MLYRVRRGQAVGLWEDHIEGDCRGALFLQLADKIAQDGSRPRPLTYPLERVLVDIDDANGQFGVELERRNPLVSIEDKRAQARNGGRIPNPQRQRRNDHRTYDEDIKKACTHPARLLSFMAGPAGGGGQTLSADASLSIGGSGQGRP